MIDLVGLSMTMVQRRLAYCHSTKLTVHKNINKEDLHSIQRIAQTEKGTERDKSEGGCRGAQLECKEVLDVMEDGFA